MLIQESSRLPLYARITKPGMRVEAALPHGVDAFDKARTHAELELANDVPTILPTISKWDTNFAVLGVAPDGEVTLRPVFDYDGPDGVRAWYEWQESTMVRHMQYRVQEYTGRWFIFTESCADLTKQTWSETVGDPMPCHVAVLFPTWTDGIIGEVALGIPEWGTRALDEQQVRDLSSRVDAYNTACVTGDIDARLDTYADKLAAVTRIVDIGTDRRHRVVARSKAELREAFASPAEGRVLEYEVRHQFTTSWYVFVAHRALVKLEDRQVERETARLFYVGPDQKFIGELTYALEIQV
jgi:hypothetical protein